MSVGLNDGIATVFNDGIATVYNVGQIKEAATPEGELISVIGSKARGVTATNNRVTQPDSVVNTHSMQGEEIYAPGSLLPEETFTGNPPANAAAATGGQASQPDAGAVAVAVVLCLATNADLFETVGLVFAWPYLGTVLTGVMISRGANYVSDFVKRLHGVRNE